MKNFWSPQTTYHGDVTIGGELTVDSQITAGSVTTEAPRTVTVTNGIYNNLDVSAIDVIFADGEDGDITFNGLSGGVANQIIRIIKTYYENDVFITRAHASGDQFFLTSNGGTITLGPDAVSRGGVTCICDGTSWFDISV